MFFLSCIGLWIVFLTSGVALLDYVWILQQRINLQTSQLKDWEQYTERLRVENRELHDRLKLLKAPLVAGDITE